MTSAITAVISVAGLNVTAVSAETLWDNGSSLNSSMRCNQNGSVCGDTGVTIYDDFSLYNSANITGFTYDSSFSGSYVSTNWSIWKSNPSINFAAGPAFSGTIAGRLTSLSRFADLRVTVSGLSVDLGPGTYWLGLQNNLTSGVSSYLSSNTNRLGVAIALGNSGTQYGALTNDASFSVIGTAAVAAIPEPTTWAMMLVGFGMIGATARYRRRSTKTTYA